MQKFVVVTASEIDSLDVSVSLKEYESVEQAYRDNGLDSEGEPGVGKEFCEYADEHEPGQETCEYCPDDETWSNRTVIVAEIPDGPLGKKWYHWSFTNG